MSGRLTASVFACTLLAGACGEDDFQRYEGSGTAGVSAVDPSAPEDGSETPYFDPETHGEGPFVALGGDPELEVLPRGEWFMVGSALEYDSGNEPGDVFDEPRASAIAPLGRPSEAFLGLPEEATDFVVRPSDGRLMYKREVIGQLSRLSVYHCDGCTHFISFPRMPRFDANDGAIESGCPGSFRFQLTLDGELVFACDQTIEIDPWFDAQGRELVGSTRRSTRVLRFGDQGTVLRQDGVLDIATQAVSAFTGDLEPGADFTPLATYALSDGYWLVTERDGVRFHVGFDGATMREGSYPLPPDATPNDAQLDENGDLLLARGWVRKLTLSGEVESLYEPVPFEDLPRNVLGQRHSFSAFALIRRPTE